MKKLPRRKQTTAIVKQTADTIAQREIGKTDLDSKQPRLIRKGSSLKFFNKWFRTSLAAHLACPAYGTDFSGRDGFLARVWREDTHWAGMVRQAAAIDANRGWSLIGGRNQVNRFKRVMHTHIVAPDVIGHYEGIEAGSIAFHTADIGCIKELARDGEGGPVRGFLHVPPTSARLTNIIDAPLTVDGVPFSYDDYFRVVNIADVSGSNPGYGYCSTSMMLALVKIMIGVMAHKQEKLAAELPQGYMTVSGMTDEQFWNAMETRVANLVSKDRDYFGGIAVLCSDAAIELKLLALSQLPDNFNEEMFTESFMYAGALVLGYDPAEFWPVKRGGIGSNAEEARAQKQKATGKGERTFSSRYYERVRENFPKTLDIQLDERDDSGDLIVAEVKKAKADVVMTLFEKGAGIIDRDEARIMAAEEGLIPRDWTAIEMDAEATDTTEARTVYWRDIARQSVRTRAAAQQFHNEPIVAYHWPSEAEMVLYDSGREMLRPHLHAVGRSMTHKQRAVLYESSNGEVVITDKDVENAIAQAQGWADEGLVSDELPGILEAESAV